MSMDFGKLNFAVGFNRTSAFPLDANSYFESYSDAQAAAKSAAEVGSSDSAYYIGQLIIVKDENNFGLYQISATKTLVKFGQANSADDLKSQLDALAARVDGLDTSKAGWVDDQAPEASAGGSLVVFDASGKINASGIKVIDSAVNNSAMEVPTSKAVQTYVATQVAGAVQYLGTVSALTGLSTTAGKGDFYRLSQAIEGAHAGDLVVAEKDNPKQLIDGENWSLIHGEEVGVESINAGAGINVSGSEAQPTIAVKPATTTTIGGIIVGDNLTVDGTGKLSAIDTTYEDATTTTHGLMSTADKIKLDGIAEGANKTIVDASLNATSTNPVQNKAVHAEFNSVRTELADASSGLQSQIDDHATLIGNKVDKVEGKGLSTNDYTTEEKNKLAGLKNYTLPIASDATLGGVKVDSVEPTPELLIPTTTPNRDYAVKADEEGVLWVTIPWTDTKYTLPVASEGALGGIKVGYSGTTAKTYAVKLDANNKAYVEVPWTDTDTNTFRPIQIDTAGTDAVAPLNLKSGTNISLALDHGVDSENVTINHTGPGSASQTTTETKADSSLVEDGGTVAFGKEFYVPSFGIDANGHTRDLKMTKYSLPTPETYSLQIATTTTLGGIKSGNKANNFVASSGGEGQTGNVPNYEAEVVVNSTTGKASVNLEAMAGPETQWSIVAGQTVFGIRQVSTDKLVQGTNTLIINGGGAAW